LGLIISHFVEFTGKIEILSTRNLLSWKFATLSENCSSLPPQLF